MILTDREIRLAVEKRTLIIEPAPADEAYASTSVDLTLDPILSEFLTRATDRYFDPGKPAYPLDRVLSEETKRININELTDQRYELLPNKLILAWTVEYLDMRNSPRLAARVEGKSSLGRLGLAVHITAPTIHQGFDGQIRLELMNHGAIPIRLRPGMRICQLIFEQCLGTPEKGYKGRFAGQHAKGSGF